MLPGWPGEEGRVDKCMQCVQNIFAHAPLHIFWEKVFTVFIIFSKEVYDPSNVDPYRGCVSCSVFIFSDGN